MKITKAQIKKIIKEELKEVRSAAPGAWLPNDLGELAPLVNKVGKQLDWDVGMAMAFAVAILEDVNAHEMAAEVNQLLLRM